MTALHLPDVAGDEASERGSSGFRIDRRLPIWGVIVFVSAALVQAALVAMSVGGMAERLNHAEAAAQQVGGLERQVAAIDQRTSDMQGDVREIRRALDQDRGR